MPWDIPAGIIQTVVGTGEAGYSGDGGPAAALLREPFMCTFDPIVRQSPARYNSPGAD